ncbi:MAG: energy-coupling factor transport system ATP-binding protein [Actinomycetota bacterium]|nr:energy-coupling factor transport system ATP-binding protein [Actinomycetota bacterium]
MTLISVERVTFRYPMTERAALADVDIQIESGGFVLLVGATGSGKSTLLRTMNGLVPHFTGGTFSGSVKVAGRDTLENPPRRLADVVAFVPQDPGSSFVLDRVEDELAYAMENLAVEPSEMRRRVEEILDVLAISELRDRSVRSLSGGERQRVAIAAALTPGARILLLDEPTSQLDPQGAEDVLNALQRLVHDLGFTVILAEHRLDRVAAFADKAIRCADGTAYLGEPAEILSELGAGPPVTRLARMLGWTPPPLTVRAARLLARDVELPEPDLVEQPSGAPRLVADRVTGAYDGHVAVKEVSLTVGGGETVALLGRNGAGKSTLLRILAGLHQPSMGKVSFDGRSPEPGRSVALCPQAAEDILFSDSVRSEVLATLAASRSSKDVSRYLEEVGMGAYAERHPRDLSSGQRLLVAIAAIAATEAPALLLDEPTRGLDPETKEALGACMRTWALEGRVIVFATHDVEMAAELAGRVVMMAHGEVVADGPPHEVLSDSHVFSPQMTRVFGRGWLTPRQVAAALGGS